MVYLVMSKLSEDLLAKFYSSHQEEHEDIATWSCRLEDILDKAIAQCDNPVGSGVCAVSSAVYS